MSVFLLYVPLFCVLMKIFSRLKAHLVLNYSCGCTVALPDWFLEESEARIFLWLHLRDYHCLNSVANLQYLLGQNLKTAPRVQVGHFVVR